MTSDENKIIMFGGSFDPPHKGHANCVSLALKIHPDAEVWIIPASSPPSAIGKEKKQLNLSFDKRVDLCELVFSDVIKKQNRADQIIISKIENDHSNTNFTVDTIEKIKDQNPCSDLFFLIGQDQLEDFHNWKAPRQILKNSSLIVISRPNTDETSTQQDDCSKKSLELATYKLLDKLDIKFESAGESSVIETEYSTSINLVADSKNYAASSEIWSLIKDNKEERIPSSWISAEIMTKVMAKVTSIKTAEKISAPQKGQS